MRDREKILRDLAIKRVDVELLLDIRDLLEKVLEYVKPKGGIGPY